MRGHASSLLWAGGLALSVGVFACCIAECECAAAGLPLPLQLSTGRARCQWNEYSSSATTLGNRRTDGTELKSIIPGPGCLLRAKELGPVLSIRLGLRGGAGQHVADAKHPRTGKGAIDLKGLSDPRVPAAVKQHFLSLPLRAADIASFGDDKCGVGLTLSQQPPYTVLYVAEGSPAEACEQLHEGDEIVAMGGQSLHSLSWEQVRALALGPEGSTLTLQIRPSAHQPPPSGGKGGAERESDASSSTLTLELQRSPHAAPWWAPFKNSTQQPQEEGEGEEEEGVEEALVGLDLHDFGRWRKLQDEETGAVFYHDSFNNRSQWDPPSAVSTLQRWKNMDEISRIHEANEQEAESERLLGWRRLQKNFENNASSVHPDVINRPDLAEKLLQLYNTLEAECLDAGVNLSAIPEHVLPPLPSALRNASSPSGYARQLTAEEAEAAAREEEETEEERRERHKLVDEELLRKVFVRRQEEEDAADGKKGSAIDHPPASPELFAALNLLKETVEQEEEDAKKKEEVLAAVAVVQECWQDPRKFGFDVRKALDERLMSGEELRKLVREVRGDLPKGLPTHYYTLRLAAAARRSLQEEGGNKYASPLVYGVDPLYNRVDFRVEPVEGGQQRVTYVGDCIPGGWRRDADEL